MAGETEACGAVRGGGDREGGGEGGAWWCKWVTAMTDVGGDGGPRSRRVTAAVSFCGTWCTSAAHVAGQSQSALSTQARACCGMHCACSLPTRFMHSEPAEAQHLAAEGGSRQLR